jgi:hypothetical protein
MIESNRTKKKPAQDDCMKFGSLNNSPTNHKVHKPIKPNLPPLHQTANKSNWKTYYKLVETKQPIVLTKSTSFTEFKLCIKLDAKYQCVNKLAKRNS